MRKKAPILPLSVPLALIILLALWSPPQALTQERNIGVTSSQAGAVGYHALVIGNNDYQSIPKLKTAEADAKDVESVLKERYGFQTSLLLNATRDQIISGLNSYRRQLGQDASLLVYYAGHGCNDKEADKVYWLPVDAQSDDTARWVSADDITTSIRVFPARHVLIVPDSCKYLNNVIEQDHRFVKKKVRASQCFKSIHTAERTLESIEAIT